jgi:hypothetical protein
MPMIAFERLELSINIQAVMYCTDGKPFTHRRN